MASNTQQKELTKTPTDKINELKKCLNTLLEIVIYENQLLEDFCIDKVIKIIPLKLEMVTSIEALEQDIKENNFLINISNDDKNFLNNLHKELFNLLNINHTKLEAAKDVNCQIIEIISKQFMDNKKQEYGYNSFGKFLGEEFERNYMLPLTMNYKI